ncbi:MULTISPECIES: DUF7537 family lipoprotein [Halorussus]|uniref:DUF7537 family lipoprotein n=1 Tax=Halorussus TaxID=1070314 RepID=UPI00209CBE04|nr:hypothetical protein [Halorussus vallis]USZ76736.1 hypothetical protein NGM07_05270 [Halorussus vallis]
MLVVCLVLAGCTGGTGRTDTTTATPTVETAGSSPSSTATTAVRANGSASGRRLAADHADALAAAESFTRRWSASLSSSVDGTTETLSLNRTARVDADGELFLRETTAGTITETRYVSPSGDRYGRTELSGRDTVKYHRPGDDYAVEAYRNRSAETVVDAFEFEADGATTLDGERVRVYAATSLSQVRHPDANVTRFDPEDVTALDACAYVDGSGLVRKFTYRVEADVDGVNRTFAVRFAYEDVGSTDVQAPSWLGEAKDALASRPTTTADPTRHVVETVGNESLGVDVIVSGPKSAVDALRIERRTAGVSAANAERFREARASAVVGVRPPGDELRVRSLALSYDESAVPNGDEPGLDVYRYVPANGTLVRMEVTVNLDRNVAYVYRVDPESAYVVLHTETWRNRST